MRKVVDLPQPEGPSSEKKLPLATAKLMSVDGDEIAEGFRHADKLDIRIHDVPRAPRCRLQA
jgi:hypothetical protein